ncbi:MAG: endo-1,4-beta-xylanase [Williamsia sp.]|nr:endo-1,4-beta-xylanase [Williamsia sp.]
MKKLLFAFFLTIATLPVLSQNSVTIEAESGTLGADFNSLTVGSINYITCTTDLVASGNPGNTNRVATYTVTFPAAGVYELYARVRIGPNGANDDSYFYGNGFGTKTVAATGTGSDGDWILANNLNNVGDTAANTIVSGGGAVATNGIWKWIDMSRFNGGEAPVFFTVPAGNLTQTFQIGGRENGLDFDKFVFGLTGFYFTVSNLNNGQPGSTTPPPPPYTPPGPPIATGKAKFLGSAYSNPSQKPNFTAYWNQVTPENAGKWGSVEATRGVYNWAELDSAYNTAKANGFPFKMHTLIWGSQQPTWLDNLSSDDQLAAIKNWFSRVAQRYPAIDFIEVVNEPLHAPPNKGNGGGNYINALGGSGATGWDWILNAFRLARQYFPAATKLWINDYSIVNSTASTAQYLQIINLLKAENLIDGIGEQAHAFTTFGTPAATITNNLNTLATAGLPLYATELDIDGPPAETGQGDTVQLNEYKRVFPLFWEHPAIKGVTVWGYRPGHWRTAQGAPLVYSNGAEKAAMVWLKQYVQTAAVPLPVKLTQFDAAKKDNQVTITWAATDETSNDHYVIERSADGINYTALFTVKSHSLLQGNAVYTTTDKLPYNGLNYYRLVQYDRDGGKTYYGVRTVSFAGVQRGFIQVYPNPAVGSFVVRAEPDGQNKGTITIMDAYGRTVKTLPLPASGVQTVSAQGMNGTYLVQVHTNGSLSAEKIVVGNK